MHDEQRSVECSEIRPRTTLGDVVEEFAPDVKRPPGEVDFDLACFADVLEADP